MAITIYSTPTCPYCKMAKNFLKELGLSFTDIDISASEQAAEEMVKKSGQMGVPVIEVNGKLVLGFDKEKITEALRN